MFTLEELVPVVADLAERYTAKESTSVSYDTANELMGAVLFCINAYWKEGGGGALLDRRTSPQEAYEKGYEAVVRKAKEARELYNCMMQTFDHYENQAYYETIAEGMPAFFRAYDARFRPQDTILTLDYPVLCSIEKENGINRIYEYLQAIDLEQKFLSRFPKAYIAHVLKKYHEGYEDLFINICRVVLRNCIGAVLAGRPIDIAPYSEEERNRIMVILRGKTKEELEETLCQVVQEMVKQWPQEEEAMMQYLKNDLADFAFLLKQAEAGGSFAGIWGC